MANSIRKLSKGGDYMTDSPEERMEEITTKMEEVTEETAAAIEQQDTVDTIV